ncbi:RecT family protein [Salmonella phage 41]|nr:RecT family protein [Salmonella phage 41]
MSGSTPSFTKFAEAYRQSFSADLYIDYTQLNGGKGFDLTASCIG